MTPALLAQVHERLRLAGVRHCILRGPLNGPVEHGHREIDVLLDSREFDSWSRVVGELGFVPMPVLGSGGHRFFTAYDLEAGEWIKLDVVTQLRYGGRAGLYALPEAGGFLDRATTDGVARIPDAGDATLALVLHCLLDKRAFKDEHRATLGRLRSTVTGDPERARAAGAGFERALGHALDWGSVDQAVSRGDWTELLACRARVTHRLFWRDPFGAVARAADDGLRRLARPLHAVVARRGFSVALVGPDGTGKSSLARLLARDPEIRGRIVYMGTNPKASTVRLLPGGASGFLPRLLEQAYRSTVGAYWRLRGRFVVFERHPWEGRTIPSSGAFSRLRRLLLLTASAPPDLMVVLDAPVDLLLQRAPEHGRERVEHQRQRYLQLAAQIPGTRVLDTSGEPERTVRDLKAILWAAYRRRVTRAKGASS